MIIASFPKGSFPANSWPVGTWPVAPAGADIQYTEVMEFAVCIATSAGFSVVLPNDEVADAMAGIIVAGAGTTAVNGTYIQTGEYYGKPLYEFGDYRIEWQTLGMLPGSFYWSLRASANHYTHSAYLDINQEDVATPDLCTGWVPQSGIAPAPTFTAATVPTLTEVATFTLEMPMVIEIETYEELSA
jgi:hypothetical protein